MKRVLVTYATRAGSTQEVAAEIARLLSGEDRQVEGKPVKEVQNLEGTDAVVIGSAVRFGQVLLETVQFVEKFREPLSRLPVAVFSVHIMNMGADEASRAARQTYLAPLRKLITPRAEADFAGVGDLQKVSLAERLIGKMVKAPAGDFRDWEAIRTWATELNTALFS